jgi:hypothetical protein
MGTYSQKKVRKFSMGNRAAYQFKLTNVQTTGSKLYTPFKKITGYIITTTDPATSEITVVTRADTTRGCQESALTFAANAESQGNIIVVGLL